MTALCFNAFSHSAYLGADPDLPSQIDAASDAGFPLFGPDKFSLDAWVQGGRNIESLVTQMARRGMRCGEIAAGVFLTDRETSLAEARHVATLAAVLQPTWVLINVGVEPDLQACETLDQICDLIAPTGARVAIEYLPYVLVNNIATTKIMVDYVGTDRAGILVDTWHHFRGPDTFTELQALPLAHIAYVQFDDALPMLGNDLPHETLHRRALPGEGEFDLKGFCDVLNQKGYEGIVSVEVISDAWRSRPLCEFVNKAYDTSRIYWPKGQTPQSPT